MGLSRCLTQYYHAQNIMQKCSVKFFFLVSCTSFAFSLLWVQLATKEEATIITADLVQEAIENISRDVRYKDAYRKADKFPKDFKYILLWTRKDYAPFYYYGDGQMAFLENNCPVTNCYVTDNRKLFGGDITQFDAVAFNGRNMHVNDLPKVRGYHQKYIYVNSESADNYPICAEQFDGFFNWTSTYRLNSDVPFVYIMIRDKYGKVVGPKIDMQWKTLPAVSEELSNSILANKSKAAAWFVSHCRTRSGRQAYVKALAKALEHYKLKVDIYGDCGTLRCPRTEHSNCDELLRRDYFFYMAMENSFDVDYVTEKLLTALEHDVVPIVYGGADYWRFLPPGSYLDARKQTVKRLAYFMNRLMNSPKEYIQFFRWKSYYTYHKAIAENVCAMCEALQNQEMVRKVTVYNEFRRWWNPEFRKRCS